MTNRMLYILRRDTERMINDNPVTVTVYHQGATPDVAETSEEFTGRLFPRGSTVGGGRERFGTDRVESTVGLNTWVVLAPHAVTKPTTRDQIAIGDRRFDITYTAEYDYKMEIFVEERQP